MSSDPRRPQPQGWKGDKSTDPRRKRVWHQGPATTETGGRRLSWRTKFILTFAAFFVLLVGVGVLAWLIRPNEQAVVVRAGAGYEENLGIPANVSGWGGLKAFDVLTPNRSHGFLSDWFGGDKSAHVKDKGGLEPLHTEEELTEALKDVKGDNVVLFLGLHGAADKDGPYVLLDSARGKQRLTVKEVLQKLAKAAPDKNRILILDATAVTDSWPLGVVGNDFARQLQEQEELTSLIKQDKKLVVICASDRGQRSWASDRWGQTVFAHYVAEGLRGGADRKNGIVTAGNLNDYVRGQVANWAWAGRKQVQIPMLLPTGQEGRARADRMTLATIVDPSSYQTEPAAEASHAPDPWPALGPDWKACEDLRARAVWVNAPHLWRQYLDTLIRYEQVVRANGNAAGLKNSLQGLHQKLAEAIYPGESVIYALPMPAVLGQQAPHDGKEETKPAQEGALEDIWNAASASEWTKAKEAADQKLDKDAAPAAYRARLAELLLRKASEPGKGYASVDQACQLLPRLDFAGNRRPAEVHLLAMLRRDLYRAAGQKIPALDPKDLILALTTRQLAEKAALGAAGPGATAGYTEQMLPLFKDQVEAADKERRAGEDLLLLSGDDGWKEARQHLEAASKVYADVQERAAELRRALATRDQMLAELPYYSHWLAGTFAPDAGMLADTEKLWANTHKLARLIDEQKSRKGELAELTREILPAFASLHAQFKGEVERLEQATNTQANWRDLEHILTVPFIPSADRQRLLGKIRQVSDYLEQEAAKPESVPPEAELQSAGLQAQDQAFKAAKRQARMALAALGQKWVDSDQTASRRHAGLVELVDRATEWPVLDEVGSQIRRQWWRLEERTNELAPHAKQAIAPDEKLAELESLARHLDGSAAALLPAVADQLVQEQRRLQLGRLLTWQAWRVYQDFWTAESPDPLARPFYEEAAQAYLADARKALKQDRTDLDEHIQTQRLQEAGALSAKVAERRGLAVDAPQPDVAVTAQPTFSLSFIAKAGPSMPPGYPVLWMEPGKFKAADKDPDSLTRRRRLEIRDQGMKEGESFVLKSLTSQTEAENVQVKLYYRGRKKEGTTRIKSYPDPDVVVYHEDPPPEAIIAARATGKFQSEAAIAFVLDWSGSMHDPDKSGNMKVDSAKSALKAVLKNVPKGTKVSLWIFGHGPKGEKTSTFDKTRIEQLMKPTVWDPDGLENQVERVMGLVKDLEPWHFTPLAEAIVRAAREIKDAHGFRTVVVLTDGEDTCFKDEDYWKTHAEFVEEYHPQRYKRGIPEFLNDWFGEGKDLQDVAINMVLYSPPGDEKEQALKQFDSIKSLPARGTIETDDYGGEVLVNHLKLAMRPKLQVKDSQGIVPPGIYMKGGLWVTYTRELPKWSRALDTTQAQGYSALMIAKLKKQALGLERGDRLLLDVTPDGLKRGLCAQDYLNGLHLSSPEAFSRRDNDWLVTVPGNRHVRAERALELTVMAEDQEHRAVSHEDPLEQRKPFFLFMDADVAARDQGTPPRLWFRDIPDYPAPTWKALVPEWLTTHGDTDPRAPTLQVWRCDRIPYDEVTVRRGLLNNPELSEPLPGVQVQVRIEPQSVHPEGLSTPPKRVQCLVVQVWYPKGKERIVKGVDGLKTTCHEHQIYRDAHQSINCFWPINPEAIRDAELTLQLLALDTMRKEVTPVKFDLPKPTTLMPPETVPITRVEK